jgi:hypothetical protein
MSIDFSKLTQYDVGRLSKEELDEAKLQLLREKPKYREEVFSSNFVTGHIDEKRSRFAQGNHTPFSVGDDLWEMFDDIDDDATIYVLNGELLDNPHKRGIITRYDIRLHSDNTAKNDKAIKIYYRGDRSKVFILPKGIYGVGDMATEKIKSKGILNPPYNAKKGKTCNTITIYPDHIIDAWKKFDEISALIPARWFQCETKFNDSGEDFCQWMIHESGWKKAIYYPNTDLCPNAQVEGGFVAVYLVKGYKGPVQFKIKGDVEFIERDFKSIGCIFRYKEWENITLKVLKKIKEFEMPVCSLLYRRNGCIGTSDLMIKNKKSSKNDIVCQVSEKWLKKHQTKCGWINKNDIDLDSCGYGCWKVIKPLADGKSCNPVNGFRVCPPDQVATGSYIRFDFGSKSSCSDFIRFMEFDLNKFLAGIRKATQSITSASFEYIPQMWRKFASSEEYNKFFDLSDADIEVISQFNRQ